MATKNWFFRSVSPVAVDKVSLGGSTRVAAYGMKAKLLRRRHGPTSM